MSNLPGSHWNVKMKDGSIKEITAIEQTETENAYVFILDDDVGTVELDKSAVVSCTCTGIKPGFL